MVDLGLRLVLDCAVEGTCSFALLLTSAADRVHVVSLGESAIDAAFGEDVDLVPLLLEKILISWLTEVFVSELLRLS